MTDRQVEEALQKAVAEIQALPPDQREQLLALVEETRQRHRTTLNATKRAMDAVDDLRLLQKYLLFDREARARETRQKLDRDADTDQGHQAA